MQRRGHNGKEVVEHLRALTPARAREIGQAALRRVLAQHTYDQRAIEVEAVLTQGPPGSTYTGTLEFGGTRFPSSPTCEHLV